MMSTGSATGSVLEYPDPRLRAQSERVTDFDDDLGRLVETLLQTMQAHSAIGLSAPQLGTAQAVLVIAPTVDLRAPRVYVNPEILGTGSPGLVQESCLSVPGVSVNVWRATKLTVRAQDATGSEFDCALSGLDAVCVQHEMDHFAGKLLVDRLSFIRRKLVDASVNRAHRRIGAVSP